MAKKRAESFDFSKILPSFPVQKLEFVFVVIVLILVLVLVVIFVIVVVLVLVLLVVVLVIFHLSSPLTILILYSLSETMIGKKFFLIYKPDSLAYNRLHDDEFIFLLKRHHPRLFTDDSGADFYETAYF